jgi:hypothetical protein
MYLDWGFALAMLPLAAIAAWCHTIGERRDNSFLTGIGTAGFGLCAALILLNLFGPIAVSAYCAIASC